jgi:hypothetical protein
MSFVEALHILIARAAPQPETIPSSTVPVGGLLRAGKLGARNDEEQAQRDFTSF